MAFPSAHRGHSNTDNVAVPRLDESNGKFNAYFAYFNDADKMCDLFQLLEGRRSMMKLFMMCAMHRPHYRSRYASFGSYTMVNGEAVSSPELIAITITKDNLVEI